MSGRQLAKGVLTLKEFRIAKKMLKTRNVRAQREMQSLLLGFTDDGNDRLHQESYKAVSRAMSEKPKISIKVMHYHLSKYLKQ